MVENLDMMALAAVIMLFGGVVKGVIGLGLPLITVSLLSLLLPVQEVVGLLALPILFANAWQAHRAGGIVQPIRRFWPLVLTAFIGLMIGVYLLVSIAPHFLYGIIGVVVVVSCILMLTKWAPHIRPGLEKPVGCVVGVFAGISGGISTVWAPPISIYLLMLEVKKEEFIRATGALFFIGQAPTVVLYWFNGIVHPGNIGWSAALVPVAFIGMTVGKKIRDRISQERFRRLLLIFLIFLGFVLIGRAI